MKYMFVSDIHGRVNRLEEVLEIFQKESANRLVLLGDTCSSYKEDNVYIAEKLNEMKHQIEVIHGNCDSYEFEKMLDMEVFLYDTLYINGKTVTVTHGHYYDTLHVPPNCGEIFIQGHTHVPMLTKMNGRIYANPGSVSKPRGTELRCYLIIDENRIILKTLEGKIVKEFNFAENS